MTVETIEVRRVLVVANPQARGYAPRKLAAIRTELERSGVDVSLEHSAARGDIERIVADRGGDFDVVAIHGGDGTINEALAGLRSLSGKRPALAIVAGGTANVLAIETGAGFDARSVARAILAGRVTPLHYGLVNGRPFVLMASAGLDAAVVRHTPPRLKAVLGKWAYVAAAFALKREKPTPDLLVTTQGETIRCRLAICANSARYGGDYVIAPETSATRAGLQLVLVTDDSVAALLRLGRRMMTGKPLAGAGVRTLPAQSATIAADAAAPAQVDGDAFGQTPLAVTAAPEPVRMIVGG